MGKIYIPFFYEVDLDKAINFIDEEKENDDRHLQSGVYDVCENEDNSFLSFANQFWELCEYEEIFDDN